MVQQTVNNVNEIVQANQILTGMLFTTFILIVISIALFYFFKKMFFIMRMSMQVKKYNRMAKAEKIDDIKPVFDSQGVPVVAIVNGTLKKI